MSRYFVEFSYDGSDYHGLQKQPNSITIQEVIENNFEKFIGSEINLVLAGRTDAGVHAKQMYAHFDVEKDFEKDIFCKRLNTMLPKDICIESINLVSKKHMLGLMQYQDLMSMLYLMKKILLTISLLITLKIILIWRK